MMDLSLKYLSFFCVVLNIVLVAAEFKFQSSFSENGKIYECPGPGVFASPYNCRWFYTCTDSLPEPYRCADPFYFDDVKKSCVCKSEDLKCGPIKHIALPPPVLHTYDSPECFRPACKLPNCFCSENGFEIPGNLHRRDTPQMIILTFTGPVNAFNIVYFERLFEIGSHENPNGCSIKGTFFIPHEYTSYYYVQKLYAEGHEIAMQTLTNRHPDDIWTKASEELWAEEVIGLRETLHVFSNISREDLVGVRAPSLQSGGNNMWKMMLDFGVDYDSSLEVPMLDMPVWPYTLDYRMPHKCVAKNCPYTSFPGIWEFPLNVLGTDVTGSPCRSIDQCISGGKKEQIVQFLLDVVKHHYTSNRAPLLLNFQSDWLLYSSKMVALRHFIYYLYMHYDDIWFITVRQALEWMRHPVPSKNISSLEAWKCPSNILSVCDQPNKCFYELSDGNITYKRHMELCGKCPKHYPGVRTVLSKHDNFIKSY